MESKMPLKNNKRNNGIKNLKSWKPGQSGNPKGRKKKELCIPDILRTIGEEKVTDPATNKPITKTLKISLNFVWNTKKFFHLFKHYSSTPKMIVKASSLVELLTVKV